MIDIRLFQGNEVRFVGTPEVPEWVARDIVSILYPEADPRNYSNYLGKVANDWKGHKEIMTPGGLQNVVTVFESGLYALITRSESLMAVPFQKWVFEEVLPSIRKTGTYNISGSSSISVVQQDQARADLLRTRLDNIQIGIDLLSQLGGVDERTELQAKDLVRDVMFAEKLDKLALPEEKKRLEYPISDRVVDLGYGVQTGNVLKSIGQIASNLYKARHGERPPKREQFVDGTTRMVACYGPDDLDIVDAAIKRKLDGFPF